MKLGKVQSWCKKEPLVSVQFPPVGYAYAHKCKTGDNWSTLAEQWQRDDVWDIIFYNFQSYEWKVVNWCLDHYYGASHTTDDRKSHVFHDSDSPGIIYIPPQWWTPGDGTGLTENDLQLRDKLLNILASPHLQKFKFVNPYSQRTSGDMFTEVASMIATNRIQPRFNEYDNEFAHYDDENNEISIGFLDTASPIQRSKYVHECLHAGQDIRKRRMLQGAAEADCYIAQMAYLILSVDTYKTAPPAGEEPVESLIYQWAWEIARRVLGPLSYIQGGETVLEYWTDRDGWRYISPYDYVPLQNAIASSPLYSDSASKEKVFDGV